MPETPTKIAIVIPVYNRRETTLQGLRSLSRIDTEGMDVRVYVVDDGSTDGTSDAIRSEFPQVDLIAGDGTLHYAAGTNRGIEAALEWEPDFVGTMNDDALFHDQFLQRMLATARKNPGSIISALLLLWDEPHRAFQIAPVWSTFHGGWHYPDDLTAFNVPDEPFAVECIAGNCTLIPVDAIKQCGVMDEKNFPHGWGDAQYFVRLRKAGWKLLVEPKALVWCEPNTYPPPLGTLTFSQAAKALFSNERHPLNLKRQFAARWHSAPTKLQALAGFGVYLLRLGMKTAKLGDPWKNSQPPKPTWRTTH